MSLYAKLLMMSLSSAVPDGSATTGDLLAELLLRRSQRPRAAGSDGRSAPLAIAGEVAYDTALLNLCRHLQLAVDPGLFGHPQTGRAHHESLLTRHGIRLDAFADGPDDSAADDSAGDDRGGERREVARPGPSARGTSP